jgi:hypothetical protein
VEENSARSTSDRRRADFTSISTVWECGRKALTALAEPPFSRSRRASLLRPLLQRTDVLAATTRIAVAIHTELHATTRLPAPLSTTTPHYHANVQLLQHG